MPGFSTHSLRKVENPGVVFIDIPVGNDLNGLRCALAIFQGIFIYISRLSRSAERSKRIFTRGAVVENAVYRCDPSREKVVSKRPQAFRNYK